MSYAELSNAFARGFKMAQPALVTLRGQRLNDAPSLNSLSQHKPSASSESSNVVRGVVVQ